jgi:hypothetical protein
VTCDGTFAVNRMLFTPTTLSRNRKHASGAPSIAHAAYEPCLTESRSLSVPAHAGINATLPIASRALTQVVRVID